MKTSFSQMLNEVLPPELNPADVHFICIGTDRSTGDSLGPLVGTRLSRLGFAVTGTLDEPCHAQNIKENYAKIPENKLIIAVDACLGQVSSVGEMKVGKGPMRPGAGVGKDLGEYGHYYIAGIVNVGGFMEYFVLQNTSLRLVISMADEIAEGIASLLESSHRMIAASIEYRKDSQFREGGDLR